MNLNKFSGVFGGLIWLAFLAFSNQKQTEKVMLTLNRNHGSVYHHTFELSGFNRQEMYRLKQTLTSGLKLDLFFQFIPYDNRMGRALIPANKYKLVINKNLERLWQSFSR